MDINGNYATTKMGHDHTKIIATGNAGYGELFYSGAEDEKNGIYGGGVSKGTASPSTDAHTGSHALNVGAGQSAFKATVNTADNVTKRFKASVWAKNGQESYVRFHNGSENIVAHMGEKVRAGDWVLLNFYTDIVDGAQIYMTTVGGNAIIDDFRLHPEESSMSSYVYNEWDELSHIIGPNNLATEYRYDEMGRLKQTLVEAVDFNGAGTGGFKKSSDHQYTYKY